MALCMVVCLMVLLSNLDDRTMKKQKPLSYVAYVEKRLQCKNIIKRFLLWWTYGVR